VAAVRIVSPVKEDADRHDMGFTVKIDELLRDGDRRRFTAHPESDALTEADALLEAQLQDVHFDTLRSAAYFLFDCRGAVQIRMGNTAVLAVSGIERIAWSQECRGPLTAWSVVDWRPSSAAGRWSLSAGFVPDAGLDLLASAAEFYVGEVPGCDAAQPNYVEDDDETVRADLANWASEFQLVHAAFV
jgi:hypothetical protein